jgi:hypothetical protein
MGCDSKLFNLKRIIYNGDFIYISRRNLELVKSVSGIMLIFYVSASILVLELGGRNIVDAATVQAVQATLDMPTMLALVVFAGLTARLELFKPKYNLKRKQRPLIDGALIVSGIAVITLMIMLKYWQ